MSHPVIRLTGAVALVWAVATGTAGADVVYTYTGQNFDLFSTSDPNFGADDPNIPGAYDSTMSVSGFFTVAAPLAQNAGLVDISGIVIDFSFDEGRNSALTPANTQNVFSFQVQADAGGEIVAWNIVLQPVAFADTQTNEFGYTVQTTTGADLGTSFICTFNGGGGCSQFISEIGGTFSPGAWTAPQVSSAPVPVPATLVLLLSASALFGAARYRYGRRDA